MIRAPSRHLRDSSLDDRSGHDVVILTTAAPPWYTGTALNALHRAQSIARRGLRVRLVFPWIPPADQARVFPADMRFDSEAAHARWIRRVYRMEDVEINFYPARWSGRWRSIFAAGSLRRHIPDCDLLFLEEPEHLLMFRPWESLKRRVSARAVVGILHTNYPFYLQHAHPIGSLPWVQRVFSAYLNLVSSRQCDQIVRLSPAVPGPEAACVAAVNGVDDRYFQPPTQEGTVGLYFIGKLIWEKGWREMLEMLAQVPGQVLHVFGTGDEATVTAIQFLAASRGVELVMHGPSASPWDDLRPFRVLVNCSRSEVLCSTTAEALAMGKFALVPRHPSNESFFRHPNCLAYADKREFEGLLRLALTTKPRAVDPRPYFDWDVATARLLATCQR